MQQKPLTVIITVVAADGQYLGMVKVHRFERVLACQVDGPFLCVTKHDGCMEWFSSASVTHAVSYR